MLNKTQHTQTGYNLDQETRDISKQEIIVAETYIL